MTKGGSRQVVAGILVMALVALSTTTSVTVVADADVPFSVNLRSSTLQPINVSIEVGQSISWRNVDSNENITHRVVYDHDGDGIYNGSMDWDSGNLSRNCELDENGTRVDADCEVVFEMHFNETWENGSYNYQDILSNGTVNNGTIHVHGQDHHIDDSEPNPPTHIHGVDDENHDLEGRVGDSNSRDWLLWLAAGSGVASVLLLGIYWSSTKNENSAFGKTEEIDVKPDADIDQIVEEE